MEIVQKSVQQVLRNAFRSDDPVCVKYMQNGK